MDDAAPLRFFVSYRRQDTPDFAGRLRDALVKRYGPEHVIRDVESFEMGNDFVDEMERALARTDVLLAIIGPRWYRAPGEQPGAPDYMLEEVRHALDRGVRIIPVLVNGAEMPRSDQLPDDLAPFVRRHAVRIDSNSFSRDVAALVTDLDRMGRRPATGTDDAVTARPGELRPPAAEPVPPTYRSPAAPIGPDARPSAGRQASTGPPQRRPPDDTPEPGPALSEEQVTQRRRALTNVMVGFAAVFAAVFSLGAVGFAADSTQFPGWLPGHEFLAVRIVLVVAGSAIAIWMSCALFFETADAMWKQRRGPRAGRVPLGWDDTPMSDILDSGRSFAVIVVGGVVGATAGAALGAALSIVALPLWVGLLGCAGPFLLGYLCVAAVRRRFRA